MAVGQRRSPAGIATDEKCDVDGIDLLPADAARATKQDTANASLASLDAKSPVLVGGKIPVAIDGGISITGTIPVSDAGASLTVDTVQLPSSLVSGRLSVDGSGVTQPVSISATVTVSDGSGALTVDGSVIVASSALPSGAATAALQGAGLPGALTSGGGVKTGIVDALPIGTNTIGKVDQGVGGASAWKVDGSAVTQPVSIAATVAISAASLPLPSGAAIATNQTTANNSLAAIDAGIPTALGQAVAASSMPVVLPTTQNPGVIAQDTSIDQVEGYLDGVETLQAATNTKLDTTIAAVDGIEGFTDGIEGALQRRGMPSDASRYGADAASSGVISAAPTTFRVAIATRDTATDRWILFFNSTTVPVAGTSCLFAIPAPGNGFTLFEMSIACSVGLSWAVSSTSGIYTVAANLTNIRVWIGGT